MGAGPLFVSFFPRIPRILVRTLLSKQKRNLVRMKFITDEYVSPFFSAIKCANLLWNFSASIPIPPDVDMIIGLR